MPYICGEKPTPEGCGLIVKQGYVMKDTSSWKGMGSAYGGAWKPAKPDDERFLGIPETVKRIRVHGKRGGYDVDVKYGPDGRAILERYHTDHLQPGAHSFPHDHKIDWSQGFPNPGDAINYDGEVPEFKQYGGVIMMSENPFIGSSPLEENRFKSISDFKWCLTYGGEVEFEWNGKLFGAFSKVRKTPDSPLQKLIVQLEVEDQAATEKWYDTADEALEYMIDGDRLRDIITQVIVWGRTI